MDKGDVIFLSLSLSLYIYIYIYIYKYIKQWNITKSRKEWSDAICSNMDGPRNYHTRRSKSDGERQIAYYITSMGI